MTLRTLAAAAVLALSASAAVASDGQVTVALQTPVAAKTKIVAGGAVFACDGATCVAWGAPERAVSTLACKTVAREAGAVVAFEGRGRSLTSDEIARCNGAAPARVAAQN